MEFKAINVPAGIGGSELIMIGPFAWHTVN